MPSIEMHSIAIPSVWGKISAIKSSCEQAMQLQSALMMPEEPARDISVLHPKFHPAKKGFSTTEGQARMLHDLASIELQAMELGLRGLFEYPDAPMAFREELMALTLSEAEHLRMCIEGIETLGFKWGDWPVHLALWRAADKSDSLLDRILIVHRYLEGSGLDAGDTLIRRLDGTNGKETISKIVQQINFEEIGHVDFGSQWYRKICKLEKLEAADDFPQRMNALRFKLPKRVEPINRLLRQKAGFDEAELNYCEELRMDFLKPKN